MNIRFGFAVNICSRVLIVLFPTNKILEVTKIIFEKHSDEVLLRSHMLTVVKLYSVNEFDIHYIIATQLMLPDQLH